jgi:hypothetical protein
MSMLTLNGLVQNVFSKPESKNKETGEIRPATENVQILAENFLPSGEKRLEMVTLKVPAGDVYRKLIGKMVRIPVGAFVTGTTILYYALKAEPNPHVAA